MLDCFFFNFAGRARVIFASGLNFALRAREFVYNALWCGEQILNNRSRVYFLSHTLDSFLYYVFFT